MINTLNIKQQQLANGFFTVGSGSEVILVMGSCRVVAFVNYLNDWNEANGNRFTIHSLDPFNFNWDINENRTDYEMILTSLEAHEGVLNMFKSVDVFIHEYYQNSGLFNVNKNSEKNIYQYGMEPKQDICLPNFNDYFILFSDILKFDSDMRKQAYQDYNVIGKLSIQTKEKLYEISQRNINKFYDICLKSDVPEMKSFFEKNFITKRLWFTYNHTTKCFTIALFKFINDRFLKLDLSKGFNENHIDMFENNYTKLVSEDVEAYNYDWGEDVLDLKTIIL